jgi:hypothetical protein
VYRLGNFLEVGNDLFMHIIATSDIRYSTNENMDFEKRIRDVALDRTPNSTAVQTTDADVTWAEVRFGVDARYRKNLTFQLLFEQQHIFDGNLVDGRANEENPGGTDVFGRAAEGENGGLHVERYWLRYKFEGTPLTLFVGAELKSVGTVGIFGNDDPGIGVEAVFGDLTLSAKAYMEREAQRLGLQNDNDLVSYAFTAQYDLKPHSFELDVVYFRDRFFGADTAVVGCGNRGGLGCSGQKIDSVWTALGWEGRFGPVRGLLQGNLMLGTAEGGTAGLPAGVLNEREYDIFAGAAIGYVEVDFGIVRPFLLGVFGSGDGNPRDRQLRGFGDPQPQGDSTQWATGMLSHFDKTLSAGTRDASCPARFSGVASRQNGVGGNPYAIGRLISQASGPSFSECYHGVASLWNRQLGRRMHQGLVVTYSNPGTLLGSVGLRVFPARGHEITGWYVYKGMVTANLLEEAFAPEIGNGTIRTIREPLYHELGGFWMWTLNPHFDIRFAGSIVSADGAIRDMARLADCDPGPVRRPCEGQAIALRGEARFRARF